MVSQGNTVLWTGRQNRPPVDSQRVFLGERGELNRRGVQTIFEKYMALTKEVTEKSMCSQLSVKLEILKRFGLLEHLPRIIIPISRETGNHNCLSYLKFNPKMDKES